jgi:membrane protein DedA with SNARE-associated domain
MLDAIIAWVSNGILSIIETFGYGGVFVLMALESANIPIPSEITMPFAGFLASRGVFSLWGVAVVGAAANLAGSLFSYWLAIKWGAAALRVLERFHLLSREEYESGSRWVHKYGQFAAFISRLLPIARTFISFPAGMFRLPLLPFSLYTFFGSLVWSYLLAYLGYYAGENWGKFQPYFHSINLVLVAVGLLVVGWWFYHRMRKGKIVQ